MATAIEQISALLAQRFEERAEMLVNKCEHYADVQEAELELESAEKTLQQLLELFNQPWAENTAVPGSNT